MRFPKHVSLVWDIPMHMDFNPGIGGVHSHDWTPLGKMPIGLSFEMPSIMAHPPGFLLGDNKLTTTVYHKGVWFGLDGHDLGKNLGHVCIPLPCLEIATDMIFSSRKAKFSAGEVRANGKAVACCLFLDGLSPPTPMLICGKIPMPVGGTGLAAAMWNSFLVGMNWIDMIAGWVDVIATVATEYLKSRLNTPAEQQALGFDPVPDFGSLSGNLVRLIGQQYGATSGDASFEYKPLGGPFLQAGESVTVDGASGDITRETSQQVGTGMVGLQGAERHVLHSNGSLDHEVSGGAVGLAGAQSTRTARSRDGGPYRDVSSPSSGPSLPWADGAEVPFL